MTTDEGGDRGNSRSLPSSWRWWAKLAALGVFDAIVVFASQILFTQQSWILLVLLLLAAGLVNWAYLSARSKAMRWLAPGLVFMGLFVVFPILYTAYISLTNWATGNVLAKEQAIERLEDVRVAGSDETASLYSLGILSDGSGEYRFYATDGSEVFYGRPCPRGDSDCTSTLEEPGEMVDEDGDGIPESIDGFTRLTGPDLFEPDVDLNALVLVIPDRGSLTVRTAGFGDQPGEARLVETPQRYVYDATSDTITDIQTDETCAVDVGNFVCPDGRVLDPGWHTYIGPDNYVGGEGADGILTNERLRGPIIRVFTWNMIFAFASVFLTFAVGLAFAMALDHERIRGKLIYRSLLILPYAIPVFISVLIWRGLLNDQFGQVNRLLSDLGLGTIPWLNNGTWAKVAVLLVNTWLGFPYMFLITTGALQSIPEELKEAARVDGAGIVRTFRTITLPLLLVSTAPLLIGSFAFNFNNFVLVYLLTDGGPPIPGPLPVGETDLLISFTFDVAVASGRGQNYALGAALSVVIFILVAIFSAVSFRMSRRLEDVYGN